MNEIVDFLTARLDEDEAAAKASLEAMREPWQADHWQEMHPADERHYVRWDPARVLREVEANRAILEFYVEPPDGLPAGNAELISGAEAGSGRAPRLLSVI